MQVVIGATVTPSINSSPPRSSNRIGVVMRLQWIVLLASLLLTTSVAWAEGETAPADATATESAPAAEAAPAAETAPAGEAAPTTEADPSTEAGSAETAPEGQAAPAGGDVPAEGSNAEAEGAAADATPEAPTTSPAFEEAFEEEPSTSENVDFSIAGALKHFTFLTWLVFITLVGMSVASLAVAINRGLYFMKAKSQSVQFAGEIADSLAKGDVESVLAASKEDSVAFSYLANIVSAGLIDARDVKSKLGNLDSLDTVGSAMERTLTNEIVGFRKWLTILATTASTAPFVGLLGTVFGIINSFKGMATSESAGIGAVAGGIAEALYMTGLGLVVAIPAVWLYNWANARIEGFEAEMTNNCSEMLDWVKKNKGSI